MTDGRDIAPIPGRDGYAGAAPERDLSAIAGNYFTAVADISPRMETSESEFSSTDRKGEKAEVTWKARRAVAAGTTLLVSRLNFLDEILHTVVLAAHPEDDDRNPLVFMADEFFTFFRFDPDADLQREEAILALQSELRSAKKRVSARPDMAKAQLLLAGQKTPSTTDLVRYQNKSDDIVARMDQSIAAARDMESEIREVAAFISKRSSVLQRYMNETINVALSTVSDSIEFATELKTGVKTMSLYTGEDSEGTKTVDVQTVATGKGAPIDEPLTLYQNLLYLDEELAVDLVNGGFDFRQMEDIGNILAKDGTLIRRMIPAERGAVLVRIRRDDKAYFAGDKSLAAALASIELNMQNKVSYLLVRNGENIHLVHSEVTTDLTEHLFPTQHEIDKIFQLNGRDIRPEHLDYSKVKNDFEKRTLYYKRILLMMWGLDHRLRLFGDFYDSESFEGWYDDRFHATRISYIHDVEHAIGEDRPTFQQWVAQKNSAIQVGSRLAVDWNEMITEKSALYCFREHNPRDNGSLPQRYFAVERFGEAVVAVKDGRLVVKTLVGPRWTDRQKPFNATVDVVRGAESSPPAAICLDDVTREEVSYYLNSRKQRRSYLAYLQIFRVMDQILRRDEETQASILAQLRADLAHSGVETDRAEKALMLAVSLWRAANNGAQLGGDRWKPKNANLILDLAFALAGERSDLFGRAKADIPECEPIDIRVNGKGQFILYWKIPDSRRPPFLSVFDDVFVMRSLLKIRRDRIEIDGESVMTYAHNPGFRARTWGDEKREFRHIVREVSISSDPELLAAATARHLPNWTTAAEAAKLHDICNFDAASVLDNIDEWRAEAVLTHLILNNTVYTGAVNEAQVVIPLGIITTRDNVFSLVLKTAGLPFLASLGEGGLMSAERVIKRIYEDSAFQIDRMRKVFTESEEGHSPLSLCRVSGWESLQRGINYLDEDTVLGWDFTTKSTGYHGGPSGVEYETVQDSLRGEVYPEYRDEITVRFVNDASRQLAETYFNAQKERSKK